MQDYVRAHLFIRGMVQGVFYRAFTRELAYRSSLKGWVRNLPDGSVEALFEGRRSDIDEAVRNCSSGPPGARVDSVDVRWEAYHGEFQDFQIRYY